jgi:hypothetical protein
VLRKEEKSYEKLVSAAFTRNLLTELQPRREFKPSAKKEKKKQGVCREVERKGKNEEPPGGFGEPQN